MRMWLPCLTLASCALEYVLVSSGLLGVSRTPRDPEYLYPLGKDELHTSVHHLTRSLMWGK